MFNDSFANSYLRQAKFQESELKRLGYDLDEVRANPDKLHHTMASHMMEEVMELMDCKQWYFHKTSSPSTRSAMIFEMVDIYKWLLNFLHLYEVSSAEFKEAFSEKSSIVENRAKTDQFVRDYGNSSVLFVDIDGVICNRDSKLLDFIGGMTDKSYRSVEEAKLGLPPSLYYAIKEKFADARGFENCEPIKDSIDVLKDNSDLPICLLSSRPVRRHSRLHFETIKWLYVFDVVYDGLIFSTEKDAAIEAWTHQSSVAVDDDLIYAESLGRVCRSFRYEGPKTLLAACNAVRSSRKSQGATL